VLIVYGHPVSPNTRKITWALTEMGAPFQFKRVDIRKGEQKHPEFLKLNPNGRVPVLDDDGFVLWESNAILWYLADQLGQGTLLPEDLPAKRQERALIDQWLCWQEADLTCIGKPWFGKLLAKMGQPLDEKKHREGVQATHRPLGHLEAHLQDKPYAVGNRFSIADIALCEFVGLCDFAGVELQPYPNLRAWLARLAERPAFQQTRPQL
jgi:glutathione S-transferase